MFFEKLISMMKTKLNSGQMSIVNGTLSAAMYNEPTHSHN